MKKLILTLSLCVTLSILATAAPAIYVIQPVYNFGSIFEGIAVTHTFVLQNTGDEVLKISGVRASCGCTATGWATDSIAPGESVDLDISINTTGFGGQTISKTITVASNDPEMPLLTLLVTGQVLKTDPHHITVSDAQYFLYFLIDLRSAAEYDAHHLLGSVNIPVERLTEALADLPHDTLIILYDAAFEVSENAALALEDEGFKQAHALVGGLNEWIYQFELKFITNSDEFYVLPPRVYATEEGDEQPSHYMLAGILNQLFYLYVDVRSVDDYAAGHIVGALNIPFEELEESIDLLPQDIVLITYDQDGSLGDAAALWLINNGFPGAQSIFRGLDEWIRQYGDSYLFPSSLQ